MGNEKVDKKKVLDLLSKKNQKKWIIEWEDLDFGEIIDIPLSIRKLTKLIRRL